MVTRAMEQSEPLCQELQMRGAEARIIPLLTFGPPKDPAPLDAALRDLAQFDWLFLTSQNAVRALVERCKVLGLPFPLAAGSMRIAAVGAVTAAAAEEAGWRVSYVARTQQGVALADELGPQLTGCSVFLPRSDRAKPELLRALHRHGARITEAIAYRNFRPTEAGEQWIAEFARGDLDAILFFSPSAVRHFVELIGAWRLREMQAHVTCAAIGPVTAAALREAGVERIVVSHHATVSGILEALSQYWSKESQFGVKPG